MSTHDHDDDDTFSTTVEVYERLQPHETDPETDAAQRVGAEVAARLLAKAKLKEQKQ